MTFAFRSALILARFSSRDAISTVRFSFAEVFSAIKASKSLLATVIFLGALFLEPLGRGIDVHTPLNYEILDCEDFMY